MAVVAQGSIVQPLFVMTDDEIAGPVEWHDSSVYQSIECDQHQLARRLRYWQTYFLADKESNDTEQRNLGRKFVMAWITLLPCFHKYLPPLSLHFHLVLPNLDRMQIFRISGGTFLSRFLPVSGRDAVETETAYAA